MTWMVSSSNVDFLRTFGCSCAGWKINLIMDCWKGRQELRLNIGLSYTNGSVLLLYVITSNWEIIEIKYRSSHLEALEDKSLAASAASPKSIKLFNTASRTCDVTWLRAANQKESIPHLEWLLDRDCSHLLLEKYGQRQAGAERIKLLLKPSS